MKQLHACLILATLICASLSCGCRTMRNAVNDSNIAAARDLTFHGMNALHHGKANQAESLLKQAANACPKDQRIRQHLAMALVEQGKIDSAIDELETAIQQSGHDPGLFVELGGLYLQKQMPRQALTNVDAALRINRQHPCAWMLKGKCELATGDPNSALASFHRAASKDGVLPEVHLLIAETYRATNRPIQALTALEVYNQNFAEDQVPIPAVVLMADTLLDLNQNHRAVERLARATRRKNSTPETWIALSRIQNQTGSPSQAILTARQAAHNFPNHAAVREWNVAMNDRSLINETERTAAIPGSDVRIR